MSFVGNIILAQSKSILSIILLSELKSSQFLFVSKSNCLSRCHLSYPPSQQRAKQPTKLSDPPRPNLKTLFIIFLSELKSSEFLFVSKPDCLSPCHLSYPLCPSSEVNNQRNSPTPLVRRHSWLRTSLRRTSPNTDTLVPPKRWGSFR